MKPDSPPNWSNPPGIAKRLLTPQVTGDRPDWPACEDLLFSVRPLRGGQFAYEGINRAFGALLPLGKASGLDVFHRMSDQDSASVREVLRVCFEERAEVRIHHSLTLGGLPRNVETIVVPILDLEAGDVVRLIGRHRILLDDAIEVEPDEAADLVDSVSLASIQEDIQQRISSELHDSTCQHLVAASLGLMRIRACIGTADGASRLCDEVDASIDRALREIRSLTYLLHPQNLMAEGLKVTIERYACGFAALTALRVGIAVDAAVDRLPYESRRSLLRVVQEGLTNVFRHARATEVKIVVEAIGERFRLTISDNGCGLPLRRAKRGGRTMPMGVGIPAMRARLAQLGGSLEIRSNPERPGTILCAVFPLCDEAKRRKRNSPLKSRVPTQVYE